jgi:hypothetical protein
MAKYLIITQAKPRQNTEAIFTTYKLETYITNTVFIVDKPLLILFT